MNNNFKEIIDKFIRMWATFSPEEAFREGLREYSGLVANLSRSNQEAYLLFLERTKSELNEINPSKLTEDEHVNYLVLLNKIDSLEYFLIDYNTFETNPLSYIGPSFIFDYLLKNYAPWEQRIKELIIHLKQLPDYYEIAKRNLVIPKIAPENGHMALAMLSGMSEFLTNLKNEVKELTTTEFELSDNLLDRLEKASVTATEALNEFVNYLKSNEQNFKGSFRLGNELYKKMLLKNERVDLSIEELLRVGENNLELNLEKFNYAARQIDPNKLAREIIVDIKKHHPTSDSLIEDTQNMLVDLRQYLVDSEFVTVPSDVIPTVMATPKAMRRWSFAAMDSPGALEKKATESYYYVTPPDEAWTDQEKEEWLQTFNYPGLLDISVHEAFPGHFLHSLHNQRTSMILAKLFGAYHFWEGYALYVEDAMWEHGFQNGDYKYRMAQLIEALLRDVRLICSIKLHTDLEFTVEDATQMFMDKVFMGRKPAESEAERGTYDPGYLNYALGKLMIEKLKEDYRLENGKNYTLKTFHDRLLSYGAMPVPLLRRFILKLDDGILI